MMTVGLSIADRRDRQALLRLDEGWIHRPGKSGALTPPPPPADSDPDDPPEDASGDEPQDADDQTIVIDADDTTDQTPAEAPDEPMTPEQARAAIEEVGGRVNTGDDDAVVTVFLNRTQITDRELRAVKYLPEVRVLNLTGTPITDRGLEHLHGLTRLERLYPARTGVTDEGLEELQDALPELQILK